MARLTRECFISAGYVEYRSPEPGPKASDSQENFIDESSTLGYMSGEWSGWNGYKL